MPSGKQKPEVPATSHLSTRIVGWPERPEDTTTVELRDTERWPGYDFTLVYANREIVRFEIRREGSSEPLTAQLLQRIPLGALDRAAKAAVEEFLGENDRLNPQQALVLYPNPLDWLDEIAHPPATDREHDVMLARLCERYLELNGRPGWREILARQFPYEASSIQTIIGRARRRRFLTPVPRGQFGGQLTPKARRLLAPPKMESAWERATEEMRTAALERERLRDRIANDLLTAYQAGDLDSSAHRFRLLALDAVVMGWTPREIYPDEPDLAEIEAAAEYLRTEYKELQQ